MGQGSSAVGMQTYMNDVLLRGEVHANDSFAWRNAFVLTLNSSEIATILPVSSLRTLRKSHPATLASLLYNCIRILDRTTALQLGLERYLANEVHATNIAPPSGNAPDAAEWFLTTKDEDAMTCLLYLDERDVIRDRQMNGQRVKRNKEEAEKKRAEAIKKAAKIGASGIMPALTTDPTTGEVVASAPVEGVGAVTPENAANTVSGVTFTNGKDAAEARELQRIIANPLGLARGMVEKPRTFGEMSHNERRAFQNALALIYRIMPIVLEEVPAAGATASAGNSPTTDSPSSPASSSSLYVGGAPYAINFLQSFFWENRTCFNPTTAGTATMKADGVTPADATTATTHEFFKAAKRPLGEILVNVLTRAAFIPGYTVDMSQGVSDDRPFNMMGVDCGLVWGLGVGASQSSVAAAATKRSYTNAEWAITNRRCVIDALMTTVSGALYVAEPSRVDMFLDTITDPDRCPLATTLACSLVNTVCAYSTFGSLPFSSHFVGQYEQFVQTAAGLVNVMLNTQKLYPSANGNRTAIRPNQPTNFYDFSQTSAVPSVSTGSSKPPLALLHAPSAAAYASLVMQHYHSAWPVLSCASATEVSFVLKGLLHLVNNRTHSRSTRLPGTQRRMANHDAFFMLMWKLVDRCPNFFEPLTTDPEVGLAFVMPLLDYGLAAKTDVSLFANAQIVAFTLMRLSASRDFAILLNAPVTTHIPFAIPPIPKGTYNDLIIVCLLQLLNARQQPTRAALALAATTAKDALAPIPERNITADDIRQAQLYLAADPANATSTPLGGGKPVPPTSPFYRPTPTAIMSIHETCAIIICNISPYVTSMLTTTAMGLTSFFELATRPSWLGLHPSYPNILALIIESFANIIQYQYRACPTVLYNLCRDREKIHKIHKEITEPLRELAKERALAARQRAEQQHLQQLHQEGIVDLTNQGLVESSTAAIGNDTPTDGATDGPTAASQQQQQGGGNAKNVSSAGPSSQMAAEAEAAPTQLNLSSELIIPMPIREKIKIGTLLCAVDAAEPIIVRAVAKAAPSLPDPVTILTNTTLVGLLPAPHPIIVRKFDPHPTTDAWSTAVLWGSIFTNEVNMGDAQRVKLFSM